MFCPNCGVPHDTDASSCGSCGYEMMSVPQGQRVPVQREPARRDYGSGLELERQPRQRGNRRQLSHPYDDPAFGDAPAPHSFEQEEQQNAYPFATSTGPDMVHVSKTPDYYRQPKSRLIYILLAIFLGTFGVHNFYAGYTSKGVSQILMTFLSCGILAGPVVIWNVIEVIITESDGDGHPMLF